MIRITGGSGNEATGFTLIEILVALTILALSFTVIMQLISGGLRAQRLSEDYRQAVYLGQAKMEEVLLQKKLAPGVFDGNFGGDFSWKLAIAPADIPAKEEGLPTPFRIDLRVNWQEGFRQRNLDFSTLQLAERKKSEDEQ